MAYQLTVVLAEQEFAVRDLEIGKSYVVGREPPCDILVPHDSVSRRHCQLTATTESVRVTDLGSSNGLYVDGQRVRGTRMRDGSEVILGAAVLRVAQVATDTRVMDAGQRARALATGGAQAGARGPADAQPSSGADRERSEPTPFDTITATTTLHGNRQEYQRLERERLALLIETGKSLAQSADIEELLDRIVAHLFEILPVRRAVIALTSDGEEFVPSKVMPPQDVDDLSAVASQSILRGVARTQEGKIFDDAANAGNLNPTDSIVISNIRAAICAPIVFNDRCLGAIYADYPGRVGLYRPADLDFLTAFASIAAVSLEHSRMIQELRTQERLRRDMEVASEIQKGLLPQEVATFPGLEVDWTYWPATSVGGDFVDVFQLDDGRVVALLGDVSGKSVPAALYMARTLSMLRAALATVQDPGEAMTRTNELLGEPTGRVVFATTFIAVIDTGSGTLQWCSAGHNPVLIREPASGAISTLDAQSPPLGVVPGTVYETVVRPIPPGALISMYTDGLVEARDDAAAELGLDRLFDLVRTHGDEPLTDLTAAMLEAVRAHIADSRYLRDDVCILNLRLS